MTNDIHSNPSPSFRRTSSTDLDRVTAWVRRYLSSRTASDWVFFGCGIALGHFFF